MTRSVDISRLDDGRVPSGRSSYTPHHLSHSYMTSKINGPRHHPYTASEQHTLKTTNITHIHCFFSLFMHV